jgi:hypothetical protein
VPIATRVDHINDGNGPRVNNTIKGVVLDYHAAPHMRFTNSIDGRTSFLFDAEFNMEQQYGRSNTKNVWGTHTHLIRTAAAFAIFSQQGEDSLFAKEMIKRKALSFAPP